MPQPANSALYKRYQEEAEQLSHVAFVGRLANYKYYNRDQVVAQALATFKRMELQTVSAGACSRRQRCAPAPHPQ